MIEAIDRRKFIGVGLAAAACLAPVAQEANAYSVGSPLGFAAHGLRALMDEDFPGTLKKMAAIGYKRVEMTSFKGYSANTPRDGFGPLAPLDPSVIRRTIHDAGLECIACEFKFAEFEDNIIDQTMEWAHGVNVKYMTVSDLMPTATLDDWKRVFEKLNRNGERVRKEGMRMVHHTGSVDWAMIDGSMPMDLLLQNVDAEHCQIELDLESTVTTGVDGAEYMDKHPGRFFSIHLRDAKTPTTLGKYINSLPLGQGNIDWKRMFRSSKKAGVKMYDVEMEIAAPGDPIEAFRISYDYIRDLKI